jgi:hypothetical protein
MGLGSTRVEEKRLLSEAALHGSAALPFVISTEAQRSGEICVFLLLLTQILKPSLVRVRQQPVKQQRPDLFGRTLLKAINKLPCEIRFGSPQRRVQNRRTHE